MTLVVFFSCSTRQDEKNISQKKHPSWQNNYYKYKTNKPDVPEDKLFRLGFEPDDTVLQLEKLKGVEIINANSTSIDYIPENLKTLSSLKSLNLTWTKLDYFPRVVFEMPQLVSLDFAFRDSIVTVDTLTHNFLKLPNLELLSLISCGLRRIPEPITELKRLKYLNLSQNSLRTLSINIGRLDSLIDLDLSQNKIEGLPNELRNLKFLEKLNLYDNSFTSFPISTCNLINLRELDLRYNDIRTLNQEILNLKNIENLDLSNNPNLNISKELAELINKNLSNLKTFYLVDTNHTEREKVELTNIFKHKIIFDLTE
jgi:Leucine-rich repeat (LRR) protein